ncbi:MAG TPA: hypothetical protein VIH90_05520 [Candidatus Saccharimonadales bacterium]
MSELDNNVPRLPEHYRKRRMLDMYPDEIAHLYSSAIIVDKVSGFLFVDRKNTLEADSAAPTYYGNRLSVMRILSKIDGLEKFGFVADLRHAKGEIREHVVTLAADASDVDKIFAVNEAAEGPPYEPLLAAIVLDEDGIEQYIGDLSLVDYLDRLRESVDAICTPDPETLEQPAVISSEGAVVQPSLFDCIGVEIEF